MKHLRLMIIAIASLALMAPQAVLAFEIMADESVVVARNQVIDGNLYAAGNNISIDGNVQGDVICGGQNIVINGNVDGSVICVGQSILVNGVVKGSVRTAGNSINIASNIGQNLMVFGANVIVGDTAIIGWDTMIGAAFADIRGKIGRDLHGGAANVNITGSVGGDIDLSVSSNSSEEKRGIKVINQKDKKSNLTIGESAIVGGVINYKSNNEIRVIKGAQINGKINREEFRKKHQEHSGVGFGFLGYFLYSILSTLIVGFVFIKLCSKKLSKITDTMCGNKLNMIGRGTLIVLLAPIVALIIAFSIIGIPLSLLILAVWIISMYLAKVLVAIMIGRKITEKYWKAKKTSLGWALLIGVVALKLVISIPIIGWILCLLTTLWGVGAIYGMHKNQKAK